MASILFRQRDSISKMHAVEHLEFRPASGLGSAHIQTILPYFLFQNKEVEYPFVLSTFALEDGDALLCKMSKPPQWLPHQKTIVMLHGLGGSDLSTYMIRMCRKFCERGDRVLRVNLRGSGEGAHLAKKPYHGGTSHDILQVIQTLKKEAPDSPIILIGYSLGGNIVLKLMGELGKEAFPLIEMAVAICAPIDLTQTMELLSRPSNYFYHKYYVKGLRYWGSRWIRHRSIKTIMDFDNIVTGPCWGYSGAHDYYQQCSSKYFLPRIEQKCHLIFAADDPFIDYSKALQEPLSSCVKVSLAKKGGHMGFFGWAGHEHRYHWLDSHLLKLVNTHRR